MSRQPTVRRDRNLVEGRYAGAMAGLNIRQYGDPVLKERTREVDDIDGGVVSLVDAMIETMYAAPGTGLAANQVGVQRRIFVYDVGEGARTVINPRIVESDGEWAYEEGCLSVPGLSWEIVRPNAVHLVGVDLDGNDVSIEATELEGRVFQHELDHLDGILLVERLDEEQRKEALKVLRTRSLDLQPGDPDGLSNLFRG
jgi:peptide deformylase